MAASTNVGIFEKLKMLHGREGPAQVLSLRSMTAEVADEDHRSMVAMNSRERVLAALNLRRPDRIPFCDVAVDRGLAQKLLNWETTADIGTSSRTENPYTLEESKAISSFLGLDNINYLLRAPTYAHKHAGKDGPLSLAMA